MIDLETLINEEEQLAAECREAGDRYLERSACQRLPQPVNVWSRLGEAAGTRGPQPPRPLVARPEREWIRPAAIQGGDTADLPGSARHHLTADCQSKVFPLA